MPCMMHGLMRKRGIVVVGGMERFKSGHLDIVVAGVVIGLRSADANGCVDAREHHFKLNVAGFGIGDDRGGGGIFAVQSFALVGIENRVSLQERSEERRVGKECVRTGKSRW